MIMHGDFECLTIAASSALDERVSDKGSVAGLLAAKEECRRRSA